MNKNVVFCADGTWNGPDGTDSDGKPQTTNVFKLFYNLDGADTLETAQSEKERERVLTADGSVRQIAKYLHGVGDSDNPLVKIVGGVFGRGLITRIVRGYTFLSRNYSPGDRIFIIGFSRGAYTARALAGLVADKGLLDAAQLNLTDKRNAYRLGASVWYEHQTSLKGRTDWLGEIERAVDDLPGYFTSPPGKGQRVAAQIEAVAVWDTVGALGIPEYNRRNMRVDDLRFADRTLSPGVRHGFHAVAVDEQREDFTPTLWHPDPPRITQALFAGAHSDVGGGYPVSGNESGLSDGPLRWMTAQLAQLELLFLTPPGYVPKPDATGLAHCPWISPPWDDLERGPRRFPDKASEKLHVSPCVLDRMAAAGVPVEGQSAPAPYIPSNLIPDYIDGRVAAPGVVVEPGKCDPDHRDSLATIST
jgi:uncharacterized protein (DUF2235 family)